MKPRATCNCPACTEARREVSPIAQAAADLVRALGSLDGKGWLTHLAGRPVEGNLEQAIERWLSEPGSAARTLARLTPAGRLAVALLAEAPIGLSSAELNFELTELGGRGFADRAIAELSAAGLIFTMRRPGDTAPLTADSDTVISLPEVLRGWLGPAALPMLLGSARPPSPPPSPQGGVSAAEDPGVADAIALGALQTVGARATDNRLYKKDRERLEALSGVADADQMVRALARSRLIRVPIQPGAAIEVRWSAVSHWARCPAATRTADDLARLHGGLLAWLTLVDARGAWVEEIHLARRFRLYTSPVYSRPRPNPAVRRQFWERQRADVETWPEVESIHHDVKRFYRLQPALATVLSANTPAEPTAKIFVQADFEVVVPRDAGLYAMLLLARAGHLARADVVATFKLTPQSIRQAVVTGLAADTIIADLKRLAAHGIPLAVERAIADWAGSAGRCSAKEAVVVRFDDEALATRAIAALGRTVERIGPCTLVMVSGTATEAEALLRKAGFPPRDADRDADDGEHIDGLARKPIESDGPSDGWVDRASAVLGLRGSPEPIDEQAIASVRAARAGRTMETAPRPITTTAGSRPRLPVNGQMIVGADRIVAAIGRAVRADADMAVVLRDGRQHLVRPRFPPPNGVGARFRGVDAETGTERELVVDDIASALVLFGTARAASRSQPCPCGSGRKFKRCCLTDGRAAPEMRV